MRATTTSGRIDTYMYTYDVSDPANMEKGNNFHWGIIYNKEFWLEVNGKRVFMPVDDVKSMQVNRKGVFSNQDEVIVHLRSGKKVRGVSRMDYLKLMDPKSKIGEISFRNIREITVGGVRKLKFRNWGD